MFRPVKEIPRGVAIGQERWHSLEVHEVEQILETSSAGLSGEEVAARLSAYGPNELPHAPPPTALQIALRQFRSPLIYILAIAAVVSLLIHEPTDAAFIAVVLVLNAVVGGFQEWKAEQSTRALQQLLQIRASVLRDGEFCEVNAAEVAPGDIAWIESGNRVPADIRLISAHGLEVDESLLTGESLAVAKCPHWLGTEQVPLADRQNMVYAGSTVVRGRGEGIVVATAGATSVGQLALDVLGSPPGKPPLMVRLERFTNVISIGTLLAALIVAALGVLVRGYTLQEMFLFSVALAVAAIPEGLPVALTVALAIATSRMARRGVIVRRLAAVEGLGSCTLVASDKTGTLTCNALTVRQVRLPEGETYTVSGEGFVPAGEFLHDGRPINGEERERLLALARAAVLTNEADLLLRDGAWAWRGDAVDVALLVMAHKLQVRRQQALDECPEFNRIPFEPERQFSASFHQVEGRIQALVKGAPERVLAMCDVGRLPASPARLLESAEAMGRDGYRVLALAAGEHSGTLRSADSPATPEGLALLGFVGMIDPLRPGVREAINACREAGVAVAMVTGDHPVTALAIARDLGLAEDESQVVVGTRLSEMSPQQLEQTIRAARVFARVAPRQKLDLVEAARRSGQFVAVTGDGVNDAPALRAANIGVAMGKSGTDVARDAAELVISDDNFATIVAGIEEGRVAFDNIRKVIFLLISTGAAELIMAGLALGFGLPLPLLAVQLLWLNLVTNGIQDIALAFEPGEGDVLRRQPRSPHERIFNRLMIERTMVASTVMGVVGFAAFWWMLDNGWTLDAARNGLLLLMVLFENVHIGNCRSETKSALRLSPFRSPILLAGAAGALLLHLGAMYLPLTQNVLHVEPVSLVSLAAFWGLALTVFLAVEIHKWIWNRNERNGRSQEARR